MKWNEMEVWTDTWNEMKWNGSSLFFTKACDVKWNLMKCFFFMKFHWNFIEKKGHRNEVTSLKISLPSSCNTSRRLVRAGSLLCVWMGRARVLSYWSRKSFPGCSASCVRHMQSMASWKTLVPLLNPSGCRPTWWEMYRLQRWSGTSPSFVIVLTTFLRWSPGLPASRSHSSIPDDRPGAH